MKRFIIYCLLVSSTTFGAHRVAGAAGESTNVRLERKCRQRLTFSDDEQNSNHFPSRSLSNRCSALFADHFMKSLPKERQRLLLSKIHEIQKSGRRKRNSWLTKIFQESDSSNLKKPVILIVSGLSGKLKGKGLKEWYKTLHYLKTKNINVYFYYLSRKYRYKKHVMRLEGYMRKLVKTYPHRSIMIFAHSAGGVVSLLAQHKYKRLSPHSASKISLFTMASPLNGYRAPKMARMFHMFAGALTMDIGIGLKDEFLKRKFSNCSHYINTNGYLDFHAQRKSKLFPLMFHRSTGHRYKTWQEAWKHASMPCGNQNSTLLHHTSHASIIEYVVRREVGKVLH